jgi:hypothetical protein
MKILLLILLICGSLKIGAWVAEYQLWERARKLEIPGEVIARLFNNKVAVALPEEEKGIPNP